MLLKAKDFMKMVSRKRYNLTPNRKIHFIEAWGMRQRGGKNHNYKLFYGIRLPGISKIS